MPSIINATIWSSIQRFGGLAISFISNIVLARLLSPDDYGVVGFIMIFVGLADVLIDGGLGNALIQKKDINRDDISTVFTTNMLLSIALFVLLFFLAPFIENYVNIENFGLFLRVEAVMILLRTLYVVHFSILNREMDFQKIAIISLGASTLSTVVAISMAYTGFGVWSLIVRNLAIDFVSVVLYFLYCKIDFSIYISKVHLKSLFSYGFFVAISNLAESLYSNIVSFVLGKKFSVKELGYYNQAYALEQIPVYSVTSVLNQVIFPFLSKEQDDKKKMNADMEKSLYVMSFLMYPLMSFLIFFAKPIIVLLYSEKWLPSVPFFQILCVIGFVNFIYHLNRSVLKAVGKANVLFYTQIAVCVIGIVLIMASIKMGIFAVVMSVSISSIIGMVIVTVFSGPYIELNLFKQLKCVFLNLIISLAAGAFVYWVVSFWNLTPLVLLIVSFLCYAVVYLLVHYILHTQSFGLVKVILISYINQKKLII